jgi:hypothetical protein
MGNVMEQIAGRGTDTGIIVRLIARGKKVDI